MAAYYNEWDKDAAAWLRELIKHGLIADGYVDERSITDVHPDDLKGFTQCHFFAGIGGWSYALRLAGIPDTFPCWSGSPPCQPFSVAGKQLGRDDPRHLAPAFLDLVAECRPQRLYGEQVAAAIGKHWLDALFLELEEQGYVCGAAVLPACSVGAPHKRDRLFFGAQRLGNSNMFEYHAQHYETVGGPEPAMQGETRKGDGETPSNAGAYGSMADTNGERLQRQRSDCDPQRREGSDIRQAGLCDGTGFSTVADGDDNRQQSSCGRGCSSKSPSARDDIGRNGASNSTNTHYSFWSDADWLGCRDGKFRPVEPGTFPLAHGIPARVGRLRGYGNAIVPQVAAEFVQSFEEALEDLANFRRQQLGIAFDDDNLV